jgi:(p)ppGpp synthase/HD superfamily hydrolase
MTEYGERFERALQMAQRLHRGQVRRGNETPYIAHLLGVTSLVGAYGGDEDQAIAALLHDSVEDCHQDHPDLPDRIQEAFGEEVLRQVLFCTDFQEPIRPPWRQRKEIYLDKLRSTPASEPALLVVLADKLYNARAIARDLSRCGEELWERFTATREDILWYYRSLADILGAKDYPEAGPQILAEELADVVERLET